MSTPEPSLFAGIGERRRRAAPPGFALFVALGLVVAVGLFVWDLNHPPERVHAVRADLVVTPEQDALEECAAWEARRAGPATPVDAPAPAR